MNQAAPATRPLRLALVGTPNCGKTALFNALTGSRQHVANYPGVTVERKEGSFATPSGKRLSVLDLPGTYSLRARSPDEVVTREVLLGRLPGENVPDLLIAVGDATHLRLTLRLVLELKQLGRPMLLVLNMADIARHRGFTIDEAGLSEALGMPVVSSIAVRRGGTEALLARLDGMVAAHHQHPDMADPLLSTETAASAWKAPGASEVRAIQRQADAILARFIRPPERPDTLTARLDAVLLHPVAGLIILMALLFLMFQAVFTWAQPVMDLIDNGFTLLGSVVATWLPDGLLQSFIQNGVIAGVGSVIVFLPQILVLFLFILVLEDLGYMARAAFLMDRIMGGAGLHGRAFIPLLSSFACAIPGIMATRVIDSKRDRIATILVAPLITCSARIPVYTLIISAFVPDRSVWGGLSLQGLVMFGLYAVGIASALGISWLLKRFVWRNTPPEPFMLELPDYKLPRVRSVLMGVWQRAKAFLYRAGTRIFAMMVVIWFLSTVPGPPEGSTQPAIDFSFAAMIGHVLEPILAPIGFNWQIGVALVPGMAAREVAVAALGTVYAVQDADQNTASLATSLAGHWSLATALAFLAWYIFAPQCTSTLSVVRRETGSTMLMWVQFFYMLALAYAAAFATYHIAASLGAASLGGA